MVDAFGLAGFLSEAIDALIVMMECYAFTGDDDSALREGRFALRFSLHHHIPRVRAHVPIEIGIRLLPTKHWQCATRITYATPLDSLDAYHRELLSVYFEPSKRYDSSGIERLGRSLREAGKLAAGPRSRFGNSSLP
jgi:hypothetical protein